MYAGNYIRYCPDCIEYLHYCIDSQKTKQYRKVVFEAVLSAIRGNSGEGDEKLETIQISLAAARVNAGLTQEEVATRIGVSKQTIINWEKGRIVPGIPEIEILSSVYDIPQDNIFLPCYSTKSRK